MKKGYILAFGLILTGLLMVTTAYAATSTKSNSPTNGPTQMKDSGMQGGMPGVRPDMGANMTVGSITSISGSTIVIEVNGRSNSDTKTSYTVDVSKATFTKMAVASQGKQTSDTTITLADLKVGDHIIVQGQVSNLNIAAETVKVTSINGEARNQQGSVRSNMYMGTVTQVDDKIITITSKSSDGNNTTVTYTVDTTSATINKIELSTDNKRTETTITVSDIVAGNIIEVSGDISGTNITAKTVTVKSSTPELKQEKNQNTGTASNNSGTATVQNNSKQSWWGSIKSFFSRLFNK